MVKGYMILDLQYGSTGKGLLAGYLAETQQPDVTVAAFGPNAGHTYIDASGEKYIHKMLPMGVFSPKTKRILLGPGSVIDVQCLKDELTDVWNRGRVATDVYVHPNATILKKSHADAESSLIKIGSTMKGTAAAVMDKMMRQGLEPIIARDWVEYGYWISGGGSRVFVATHNEFRDMLFDADCLQVEGAQGWSLSINGPFYPYCTSRPVSSNQLRVDCDIPAGIPLTTIGTARTKPIRVANRFDEEGKQIGYSGDHYFDQEEVTWESLGISPELTTVTGLVRRVFTFSIQQIRDACLHNDVKYIFLNFCNYIGPTETDKLRQEIYDETGVSVRWSGWGPQVTQITRHEDQP